MPAFRDESPKPGDSANSYSAKSLLDLYRRFAEIEQMNVVAPLQLAKGPTGRKLGLNLTTPIIAKLSGSSSPYSFTQQVMQGGSWTDGPITGTGNAYEVNSASGLGGKLVRMQPGFAGQDWRFRFFRTGTGAGTDINTPGCACSTTPATITMTVTNPSLNNQIFNSCTIQNGPTPSSLLPVVLTANSWLSTTTFSDPILGVPFYYFLTCTIGKYVLTRVYVSSPFGSPFRDSIRYQWVPGFPGNTCGSHGTWAMTNGSIFVGGDPRTTVVLTS
jgi:hypothetical protein